MIARRGEERVKLLWEYVRKIFSAIFFLSFSRRWQFSFQLITGNLHVKKKKKKICTWAPQETKPQTYPTPQALEDLWWSLQWFYAEVFPAVCCQISPSVHRLARWQPLLTKWHITGQKLHQRLSDHEEKKLNIWWRSAFLPVLCMSAAVEPQWQALMLGFWAKH